MVQKRLLIGLSPRLLRQVPAELGFRGKTLQYLEQSVAHRVMNCGALVVMIPTIETSSVVRRADLSAEDYAATLDGLILQGGADIDPAIYGEELTQVVGPIDRVRDEFELDLLHAFAQAGKPVLGICRGMQLINVAFGGTLYHDLNGNGATAFAHYLRDLYDEHQHELRFREGGWLAGLYPTVSSPRVNSIHHQGVRTLGSGLTIEAWSDDDVVECIRRDDHPYIVGVQWHPEFHDERFPHLLPTAPLLQSFMDAVERVKSK